MTPGRRRSLLLGGLLLTATVGACDAPRSATPPEPPMDGALTGAVRVEGVGMQGVSVTLAGPLARSANTDAAGRFRFDGLGEGSYSVSVAGLPDDADFSTTSASATLSRAQPTATLDFSGAWKRDATLSVLVRVDGVGLEAATVRLSGPEATSGTTDGAGSTTFEGLRRGTWEVTLEGYDPLLYDFPSRTATVAVDGSAPVELAFDGTEIPQPPNAPTGLVATAAGADAIELTWSDASDDEDRFEVDGREPGGAWALLAAPSAGETSYTDSGLDPASTWTYRVRACNEAGGCSAPSSEAAATTLDVPPTPPTGLAATATGPNDVRLSWSDTSGNEERFEVERRGAASGGAPAGPWAAAGTTGANATEYDDGGLSPATTYEYRLRACNALGCSAFTSPATATTDDVPPLPPTGPAVVVTGATSLRLTWSDASDNEDRFDVQRREGGAGAWEAAGTAPADAGAFDDIGLSVTTEYGYRVRACNEAGCSDWTTEATGTTADVPPLTPTDLTAGADGENAIDVSWTDASANETGFELQSGPDGASWAPLVSLPAGSTSHADGGLAPGTTRYYRVRACNGDGCSDWSSAASATTEVSPPVAPSGLSVSADGEDAIDVTWTDESDNETSFRVQRSADGSSWSARTTRSANSESWTDTGLSAGETWHYRVRACNAGGCSGWSNSDSATTDTQPPSGLNLSVGGVYINQRVQRLEGDVPLVADVDGYLRVFVVANESNTASPDVRVEFYLGGGLAHSETISAPGGSVPQTVNEGTLGSSWNVRVDGSLIQPGLELKVVLDPSDEVSESVESDNDWPAGGGVEELDVRDTPTFEVTFVPIHQTVNGRVGDVDAGNASNFLEETLAMLPFADADFDIRAEYSTDLGPVEAGGANWGAVLSELNALRSADGSSRFYYGVLNVSYGGGTAGIGYVGWPPVALGWDKPGSAGSIAAHEWGHNLGRRHSPGCGAGSPDASYPHAGGGIGHWGLEVPTLSVKSPSSYRDFMSYCGPEWISDYVFERIIDAVAPAPFSGTVSRLASLTAPRPAEPGLLVWGRVEGGRLILEPALEVDAPSSLPARGGDYSIEGRSPGGEVLFRYDFDPVAVADLPGDQGHFSFVVPLRTFDRAALAEIRLTSSRTPALAVRRASDRPEPAPGEDSALVNRLGEAVAEVAWNALDYPMVVVRDAETREVLSLGRSGRVRVAPLSDRIELEFSNGLRAVDTIVRSWR